MIKKTLGEGWDKLGNNIKQKRLNKIFVKHFEDNSFKKYFFKLICKFPEVSKSVIFILVSIKVTWNIKILLLDF